MSVAVNEEIVRLLNEILVELKERCRLTQEHDLTVANINDRVRKISINLSNLK